MKRISNGYEDISVEVVDYNEHLAEHAWNCYKMTWHELQDVKYDSSNAIIQDAIENIIKFRALPMPREQGIITFRLNNISRVCLAQITRQRKAAFNAESQMPEPIHHNVILPLNIAKSKYAEDAKHLIEASQNLYDKMIAEGFPPQDCRYLTMHGQTTSCAYVVDINTFVGSFGMRCENNLTDELNLVYRLCKNVMLKKIDTDLQDKKIDELTYMMYHDIIASADCMGAKQKKGMNYDKVFGNSFNRYPSANDEVKDITESASYDFKKSAWYLELKRIFKEKPELLFDSEEEMISSWKD
mgnify:FL=1